MAHKVYYNYIHGFQSATPELDEALETIFKKAEELGMGNQGDYCEFGIFKGYAFWKAQNIATQFLGDFAKMRFFGFDSFQGLPEINDRKDQTKDDVFYQGQYSCGKERVINNLNSKGVDWEKTFLIEGFFEDSLSAEVKNQYNLDKIAIALIDCDLYSSTRDVLKFISDMIGDKTILIFDDWNCFNRDNNRGQRKAFREFLEENQQFYEENFISYGAYGQVFIL
ncbi:MAG: TylF/MycF/NovP-related O-methyltransferase, partial [Cyanobacteriota bacterium]|nr:TylF/MycF/NovP-related O-methyltransferase [Cyanobacteriota bacterium]